MFKPYTIEQYKVYRLLKERLALDHFVLSPLSRTALLVEDSSGDRMAMAYQNGQVQEIPIPPPPDPETVKSFFRQLRETGVRLRLHTFEDATRWWLDHPNPLTYQQALGLPDDLYRHFLTHRLIDDGEACRLAASGIVSEDSYRDIRLWYRNGNAASCWLGPIGLDGKGNLYALTFHYGTPAARELKFYLLDDYYRYMNHML